MRSRESQIKDKTAQNSADAQLLVMIKVSARSKPRKKSLISYLASSSTKYISLVGRIFLQFSFLLSTPKQECQRGICATISRRLAIRRRHVYELSLCHASFPLFFFISVPGSAPSGYAGKRRQCRALARAACQLCQVSCGAGDPWPWQSRPRHNG